MMMIIITRYPASEDRLVVRPLLSRVCALRLQPAEPQPYIVGGRRAPPLAVWYATMVGGQLRGDDAPPACLGCPAHPLDAARCWRRLLEQRGWQRPSWRRNGRTPIFGCMLVEKSGW